MIRMINAGVVILADGSATRFGSAKQLLLFQQKTLLQHVIDEALAAGAAPVVVVTGAHADAVSAAIDLSQVSVVYNDQWQDGKASGIAAGVRRLLALNEALEKIILAVCDQPFVTAELFRQLDQRQVSGQKRIVASAYAGTLGTPVLFTRHYYDALQGLQGEEGAKKLLGLYRDDVDTVEFPRGETDIDTAEDYEQAMKYLSEYLPKYHHPPAPR